MFAKMSFRSEKELTDTPGLRDDKRSKLERRVKRGFAITKEENVAVSKAWISVSEDSTVGAEQKGDDLNNGVHVVYSTNNISAGKPIRT